MKKIFKNYNKIYSHFPKNYAHYFKYRNYSNEDKIILPNPQGSEAFLYPTADYYKIRTEGAFYVDNSNSIIEITNLFKNNEHLIFLRNPRIGKSLLISTLKEFCCIKNKDIKYKHVGDGKYVEDKGSSISRFDLLFKGTEAYKNLTGNRYAKNSHVLYLDFAGPQILPTESTEQVKNTFNEFLMGRLIAFCQYYGIPIYNESNPSSPKNSNDPNCVEYKPSSPIDFLTNIAEYLHQRGMKFLVMIDEYDRFSNQRISGEYDPTENMEYRIKKMAESVEVLKSFYQSLKSLSGQFGVQSFTTGLSSVALSEASSFNVARDISSDNLMGDAVGFREQDVRNAFRRGKGIQGEPSGKDKEDENYLVNLLREYTNGFRYPGSSGTLYNSTLIINFFQNYFDTSTKLKESLEQFRNSDGTIKDLTIEGHKDLAKKLHDVKNVNVSQTLLNVLYKWKEETLKDIISSLASGSDHENLQLNEKDLNSELRLSQIGNNIELQKRAILSLLYSDGAITLSKSEPENSRFTFKIPNKIAEVLFMEKIRVFISQLQINLVGNFIDDPSAESLKAFLESIFGSIDNPEKSKLDAGYVSSFHERSTMAIFEVAFKILRTERLEKYIYSFDKSLSDGHQIALDARISTDNREIFLEAKKIVTSDLMDEKGKKMIVDKFDSMKISDEGLKKMKIIPKKYKDDKTGKVDFKFQFNWDEDGNDNDNPKVCETVEDVITAATNQLTHYIRQIKSLVEFNKSSKKIKAFAYIHIMKNRYFIVEHKWNGKLFADSDIKPK